MQKRLRLGHLGSLVASWILFILALASPALGAQTSTAPKTCNVRDYGARGDGRTLDTRALQAAIDDCGDNGGTVYLGAGKFVSGTLQLRSHMTLKLDESAVLAGSRTIGDYWPSSRVGLGHRYGTDVAGEGQLTGLLVAVNVTGLRIEGPGIIDGESDAFMSQTIHAPRDYDPKAVRSPAAFEEAMHDPAYGPLEPVQSGRPGVLFLIYHAKDVSLEGINLRNSPNWTLVLQDVERAAITDFTIINNPLMPNNDGIDCMACRDTHIANGTIRTGDDDIVLVNGEDITVSGISMYSRSAAVRMEGTQRAVLHNLTIETNRGLAIFVSRDIARATDSVLFSNIVMRTRLMPGHWWGKAEPIYISAQSCTAVCGGVRNVTFSDIEADAEAGVMIVGNSGTPIDNVLLRDIRLRMRAPDPKLAAAIGGNFDSRWTAPTPGLGMVRHDVPAIYCQATTGLTIRNIDVSWQTGVPAYSTAALGCKDSSGLVLEGLSESGASRPGPALLLDRAHITRSRNLSLRWSGPPRRKGNLGIKPTDTRLRH